jgi:hypothetical protein
MLEILNNILFVLIAILMGIFGAYLTNWEKDIYKTYFKFIIPALLAVAVILLFIDKPTSFFTLLLFLIASSWLISTRWFK